MLQLAQVIGSIYDAAAGESCWSEVGDGMCRAVGAERVFLSVRESDGTAPNLLRQGDPLDAEYARHFHRIDPFRAAARLPEAWPFTARARLGTQIVAPDQLRRTEYFKQYASRRPVRSSIGAALDRGAEVQFGIFRDSMSSSLFADEHVAKVQYLLPHLKRGLQMRRTLGPSLAATDPGFAGLDVVPHAAFIVDGSARLVFANIAAETMSADSGSSLRMTGTGQFCGGLALHAGTGADDKLLRALIASTAAGGAGGVLRLRCDGDGDGEGRPPLVVAMVAPAPARLGRGESFGNETAQRGRLGGLALVLARDIAKAESPAVEVLTSIFGLSPVEAQVAASVLGGATAEKVAEARGVTINTVRKQIQDILRKTEAPNLRDFERVAAMLGDLTRRDRSFR